MGDTTIMDDDNSSLSSTGIQDDLPIPSIVLSNNTPLQQPSSNNSKLIKIIKDIKQANTKSSRLYTINLAIEEFDHYNTSKHNTEIKHGILNVLYNQLFYAIHDKDMEIIADICFTMTYILRCDDYMIVNLFDDTVVVEYDHEDYDTIGFDLVMLLIQIIQYCLDIRYYQSNTISRIIYYPIKVLNMLSRINITSQKFANCEELLSILVSLLNDKESTIDSNVKVEAMLLLKNIVYYSNNEYKFSLIQYPSLLQTLVYNVYSPSTTTFRNDYYIANSEFVENGLNDNSSMNQSNKIRDLVSIIFFYFTSSTSCKLYLLQHGTILNTFIHLLDTNTFTDDSTTSMNNRIKCNIMSSIHNLIHNNYTADKGSVSLLLQHYDGVFIDILSHTLKHNSNNVRLCSIVSQIYRTIITIDDTIAQEILERNAFLSTLEYMLLSTTSSYNVRLEVANTILYFISYIKPTMNIIQYFIQMLVRLSNTENDNNMLCIETSAKAILKMTLVASNHCILIQTPGLLSSLATTALSSSYDYNVNYSIRENATGALYNLSCTTNMQDKEYILSNTYLLNVLVQISTMNTMENKYSRDFAVGTLVNLSCLPGDNVRSKLVKFDGLLISLISFVSDVNVEYSVKESVKSSIIQLVSVI